MDNRPELASTLIEKLVAGETEAADAIWQECHGELMRYSRRKLAGLPAKEEIAEDVALSALKSFIMRASDGKFPELNGSANVWKLLYHIASRKAWKAYKKDEIERTSGPEQMDSLEATVDTLPAVIDELLEVLPDDNAREIARLHLAGFNNREIAEQIGHLS